VGVKNPNPFTKANKYVLSVVLLTVFINLTSAQWGWAVVAPILAVVSWLALLGLMNWLPSESRLASWIGLTILLGLPLAAAILAFLAMQFPAHPQWAPWLYWLAGLSAAMLGAAILGAPGILSRYDSAAFAFIILISVTAISPMPGWVKAPLMFLAFGVLALGFLTTHSRTAPAVSRIPDRLQHLWRWLLEDVGGPDDESKPQQRPDPEAEQEPK